jgi:hypothetical protein
MFIFFLYISNWFQTRTTFYDAYVFFERRVLEVEVEVVVVVGVDAFWKFELEPEQELGV